MAERPKKGAVRRSVTGELLLPVERYDDVAFVDLVDIERFAAACRDEGAGDKSSVTLLWRRAIDGEAVTGLRWQWQAEQVSRRGMEVPDA